MAGTRQGGLQAVKKNLAKDPDWYKKIGSKGGKAPYVGLKGFASMSHEQVSELGRKGGAIGGRNRGKGKNKKKEVI